MSKKAFLIILLCLFCIKNIYANIPFTVEIRNVTVNGGTVYICVYTNDESLRNVTPQRIIAVEPTSAILLQEIHLPEGEYVIGLLQDTNGNQRMDYGLFGIPREPYGYSNMNGKTPGNFNQLKFNVQVQNNRIIIPLIRY